MPEYIEREKAKEYLAWSYAYSAAKLLDKVPAADVVEVRHGEWVEEIIPLDWCEDDVDIAYKCSVCDCRNFGESPYCPNCGAKMDKS